MCYSTCPSWWLQKSHNGINALMGGSCCRSLSFPEISSWEGIKFCLVITVETAHLLNGKKENKKMKYHAHCRIIQSNKEKEREREKAGRKQNHITINCVLNEEWKPSAFLFGCQTEESYNVTVNPFNYYDEKTTEKRRNKGKWQQFSFSSCESTCRDRLW